LLTEWKWNVAAWWRVRNHPEQACRFQKECNWRNANHPLQDSFSLRRAEHPEQPVGAKG